MSVQAARKLFGHHGGKTGVGKHNPASVPKPALTAFGPTIEFVSRSYAPFASFGAPGLGFEGDNRDATTDPHASARITSVAKVDTLTNNVTFSAFSNESSWPALPFKDDQYSYWPAIIPSLQFHATAKPTVDPFPIRSGQGCTSSTNDNDTMTILLSHAGSLPLIPGAPDIDLHTTFVIVLIMGASIRVTTSMTGDAFPNAEAFVRFGDGRAVMLHHFETTGAPDTGPIHFLPGDAKRDMGSTTVTVSPTRDP